MLGRHITAAFSAIGGAFVFFLFKTALRSADAIVAPTGSVSPPVLKKKLRTSDSFQGSLKVLSRPPFCLFLEMPFVNLGIGVM